MSTATINLAFDDFARAMHEASALHDNCTVCEPDEALPALRLALLYGEQLSLPSASRHLQVLSGRAWVSFGGEDYILGSGESLSVDQGRDKAIISAVGGEDLFFEVM